MNITYLLLRLNGLYSGEKPNIRYTKGAPLYLIGINLRIEDGVIALSEFHIGGKAFRPLTTVGLMRI